MATLQKFKLLATQCAVAGSPTRSPTTSPVMHLRRRRTLRMLLGGGRRCDGGSPDRDRISDEGSSPEKSVGHKLKDLFVSSPPALGGGVSGDEREALLPPSGGDRGGGRALSATLRQRLMRRAWRPVLVGIPE